MHRDSQKSRHRPPWGQPGQRHIPALGQWHDQRCVMSHVFFDMTWRPRVGIARFNQRIVTVLIRLVMATERTLSSTSIP